MRLPQFHFLLSLSLSAMLLGAQANAAQDSSTWSLSQDGHPDLGAPFASSCHDNAIGNFVCLAVTCKDDHLALLFNFIGGEAGVRVGAQLPVTVTIDGSASRIRMTRLSPREKDLIGELLHVPLRPRGGLLDDLAAGTSVTVALKKLKGWTFTLRNSRSTIEEVRRACGSGVVQRIGSDRSDSSPVNAGRLPPPVQDHLDEMDAECQQLGGRLKNKDRALLTADFNQDGLTDYAIAQGAVMCTTAASMFTGSGGSNVTVFVSEPSGYREVWSRGSYGARIEGGTLWLGLAGSACGYPETARSEAHSCERALVWNPARRHMALSDNIRENP